MSRQVNLGQIVPNIQIGTTITGAPNTQASVTNVGTSLNPILNFTIPKGEAGSIKFIIVQTLPTTGIEEDAMYLVPLANPESQENKFAEYIYVNGSWEELGSVSIKVDLSNYYTKEEVNNLIPTNLSQLNEDTTHRVVSDTEKAMWNGKANTGDIPTKTSDLTNDSNFTTKAYVDNLVGDIATTLDTIQGEVI